MSQIPNAISVIIPTYNRAHLIKESLQSVLKQTLQPYEIIVVDDFSTDNTEEVIKSLNSPLIKYVKNQRKKGANGARNTGILMAQGEYIAFHDSDDIWLPEKLSKQYLFIKENMEVDLCFCLMKKLDSNLNVVEITPKNIRRVVDIKESLQEGNLISTQMIYIRTEVAKRVLFDECLNRFQDWDFVLKVSKISKIDYVPEILVIQKNSSDSITNNEKINDAYRIIFKNHPEIVDKGWNNKIQYLDLFFDGNKAGIFYFIRLIFYKICKKINNIWWGI